MLKIILAISVLNVTGVNAATDESTPKRLLVLNLIPMSDMDQEIDASIDIPLMLIEMANRKNLVPGYKIEIQFMDEGLGRLSARRFVDFQRQPVENDVLKSPIMLGPQFSTGCKSLGPFLHHFQTVSLSSFCSAPQLAEHWKYKNLYLNLRTGQGMAMTALTFIGKVGGWKRFALIGNSDNPNDIGIAMFLHRVAQSNGFEIPLFTSVTEVDEELVLAIKQSAARVIVFVTGADRLTTKLMCLTHLAGLKGQRYVFIFSYSAFVDPVTFSNEVIPGCSKAAFTEQLRQAFWYGPMYRYEDETVRSEWNYTQSEFDKMLEEYQMRNKNYSVKTGDYPFRLLFHDNAMMGLFALRKTELNLRNMNMTLSDYTNQPELVSKIANESLLNIEVSGLRVPPGKMSFNTKTGLVGQDIQGLAQWSPQTGSQIAGTQEFVYSSYAAITMRKIQWIGEHDKPPKDRQDTQSVLQQISASTSMTLIVLSCVVLTMNCFGVFVVLLTRKDSLSDVPWAKITGLLGSVILNGATILLMLNPNENIELRQIYWSSALACIVIGFSLVNAVTAMRAKWQSLFWALNQDLQASILAPTISLQTSTRKTRLKTSFHGTTGSTFQSTNFTMSTVNSVFSSMGGRPDQLQQPASGRESRVSVKSRTSTGSRVGLASNSMRQRRIVFASPGLSQLNPMTAPESPTKSIMLGVFGFALLNICLLFAWFVLDPQVCEVKAVSKPMYNEQNDVLMERLSHHCFSRRLKPAALFPLLILSLHILMLLIAGYSAYLLSQNIKANHLVREPKEFGFIKFGISNSVLLLAAFSLILSIIVNKEHYDGGDVRIVIAAGACVSSLLATAIWILPVAMQLKTKTASTSM